MKDTNFSKSKFKWEALITKQKASGLSIAAFCRQHNIPVTTFYGAITRQRNSASKQSSFVRVEEQKNIEPLRVQFAGGATLYFAHTPEPEWLNELMRLVS